MNLVKVICKEFDINGVIIGENKKAIKMITTDYKSAVIPKNMILLSLPIRNLTPKEEIEVKSVIEVQHELGKKEQQLIKLKQEIAELNAFKQEQEIYVASLIADNISAVHNKPQPEKIASLNDISPKFTEKHFQALKFLSDNEIVTIDGDNNILMLPQAIDNFGKVLSKEELMVLLDRTSQNILPVINAIEKIFSKSEK